MAKDTKNKYQFQYDNPIIYNGQSYPTTNWNIRDDEGQLNSTQVFANNQGNIYTLGNNGEAIPVIPFHDLDEYVVNGHRNSINDYLTTSNDNTIVNNVPNSRYNIHLIDRGLKGAKNNAIWEREHPNLSTLGYMASTVPLMTAAYPFAAGLADTYAGTTLGQNITNNLGLMANAVASNPVTPYADALLTSAGAAHGLQDINNGNANLMTALEVAPLTQLVKPIYRAGKAFTLGKTKDITPNDVIDNAYIERVLTRNLTDSEVNDLQHGRNAIRSIQSTPVTTPTSSIRTQNIIDRNAEIDLRPNTNANINPIIFNEIEEEPLPFPRSNPTTSRVESTIPSNVWDPEVSPSYFDNRYGGYTYAVNQNGDVVALDSNGTQIPLNIEDQTFDIINARDPSNNYHTILNTDLQVLTKDNTFAKKIPFKTRDIGETPYTDEEINQRISKEGILNPMYDPSLDTVHTGAHGQFGGLDWEPKDYLLHHIYRNQHNSPYYVGDELKSIMGANPSGRSGIIIKTHTGDLSVDSAPLAYTIAKRLGKKFKPLKTDVKTVRSNNLGYNSYFKDGYKNEEARARRIFDTNADYEPKLIRDNYGNLTAFELEDDKGKFHIPLNTRKELLDVMNAPLHKFNKYFGTSYPDITTDMELEGYPYDFMETFTLPNIYGITYRQGGKIKNRLYTQL